MQKQSQPKPQATERYDMEIVLLTNEAIGQLKWTVPVPLVAVERQSDA